MEKSNALQILNSRKLISEPGKFNLKVTSVRPFQREDGALVKIINLAAMTAYHLTQAKALFKEEKYQEATNQAISASQRVGVDYEPAKGEYVDVVIDEINRKDGEGTFLGVVSLIATKTAKATSVNFSFDDEEVEETSLVDEAAGA